MPKKAWSSWRTGTLLLQNIFAPMPIGVNGGLGSLTLFGEFLIKVACIYRPSYADDELLDPATTSEVGTQ